MADISEEKIRRSKNVLLGTVVNHECDPEEDCPDCHGSGVCPDCHGKGKDTCNSCHGSGKCTECHGNGENTCRKCHGQGHFTCKECGGSGTCRKCGGSGKIRCDLCGGRGRNNHGETCVVCGGTGWKSCDKCISTGQFVFGSTRGTGSGKCKKCKGTGEITCSECDGAGTITCKKCNGSGDCQTCSGSGELICSNCDGDGRCPDCSGSGKVTCHRCKGSGWYQTYQYYICTEYSKRWSYASQGELKSIINKGKGDIVYDSAYKVWHSSKEIDFDKTKEMEITCKNSLGKYSALFDDYKTSYDNNHELTAPSSNSDKPLSKSLKAEIIPATKIDYTINGISYSLYLYGKNHVAAYTNVPTSVKAYEQTLFERVRLALSEKSRMKQYAMLAAYIFQCDEKNAEESRMLNLFIKEMRMSHSKETKFRQELAQYNNTLPYEIFRKKINTLFMTKKTISFAWQCMAVDKTFSNEETALFEKICSEYKGIDNSEIEKLKSYAIRFARIKDDGIVAEYCDVSAKSKELRKKTYIWFAIALLALGLIIGLAGLIMSGAFKGSPHQEAVTSIVSSVLEDIDELDSEICTDSYDWDENDWNESAAKLEKLISKLPPVLEEDEQYALSLSLTSIRDNAQMYKRKAEKMLALLSSNTNLMIYDSEIKEATETEDETQVENKDVDEVKVTDEDVVARIKEFYNNYVFGTNEATDKVINKYCTKKLAKKLADDYEYEGGGYAIWDFRSGAQDGDSAVQEVNNVEALGDGKYKVSYNDMGTKGSCIITVVVDGDNILFDEISNK